MHIWAIANQKGGVGKTTTTLALGRGLAMLGHRVLVIDLDPHASLTRAFDVPLEPPPSGVLELFASPPADLSTLARQVKSNVWTTSVPRPPWPRWSGAAPTNPAWGWPCSRRWPHADQHDHILLRLPAHLGLLMINALAAADRVIVPTQAEPLALHGLASMVRTVDMVERSRRRPCPPGSCRPCFDKRTRAGNDTLRQMRDSYGDRVWSDAIPVDTRICNVRALTLATMPNGYAGRGLAAYRRALEWLIARNAVPMEQAA